MRQIGEGRNSLSISKYSGCASMDVDSFQDDVPTLRGTCNNGIPFPWETLTKFLLKLLGVLLGFGDPTWGLYIVESLF